MQEFFGNLWFQMISLVFVATFHGYGAAWLAVRMLFRPHNAIKLLGLTIFPQGIIPRQRRQLAQAIGNAVGNELVSQDTITNALFGERRFLQNKIELLVDVQAAALLEHDYGSILETLPANLRDYVLDATANLQNNLGDYIATTLRSEETVAAVSEFVNRQTDKLLSRRVAETLDDAAFDQALQFLETRVRGVLREAAFEARIKKFVHARVDDLANTETTLEAMFTPEFVTFARERALAQIQPIIHELAQIATAEKTREQIGALVKTEIGDFYQQLPFYQKFFVSRERLYGEIDDLVNTTLPRKIEETLRGAAFAQEAEKFINTTIDAWLTRPITEIIGNIAPEKLEQVKQQLANTLLRLVQGTEMQTSIAAYLTDFLQKVRPHSWRAIAERIHPEAVGRIKKAAVNSLLAILAREETARTLNQILGQQIERLLNRPIGQPSRFVAPATVRRVSDEIVARITGGAQERLPAAIRDFDLANLVREKIDAYPLVRLENLVLSVAGQHLKKIELFGLVIGFLLGCVQALFLYATTKR